MHQGIVAIRTHELAELAAWAPEMSLAIRRAVEGRRRVDVAIGARLEKMRERIAVAGHFIGMLLDIPADVEQWRRAECLAVPMRQEMRQRPLTGRYRVGLAIP